MANGTPVICSNTGSLGEIFGEHALTFDPLDKKALKICIKSLLENPELRKELIEKGLKFAQNYSWKKTAEERDQMIRTNMQEKGNFRIILNVLSAPRRFDLALAAPWTSPCISNNFSAIT